MENYDVISEFDLGSQVVSGHVTRLGGLFTTSNGSVFDVDSVGQRIVY